MHGWRTRIIQPSVIYIHAILKPNIVGQQYSIQGQYFNKQLYSDFQCSFQSQYQGSSNCCITIDPCIFASLNHLKNTITRALIVTFTLKQWLRLWWLCTCIANAMNTSQDSITQSEVHSMHCGNSLAETDAECRSKDQTDNIRLCCDFFLRGMLIFLYARSSVCHVVCGFRMTHACIVLYSYVATIFDVLSFILVRPIVCTMHTLTRLNTSARIAELWA